MKWCLPIGFVALAVFMIAGHGHRPAPASAPARAVPAARAESRAPVQRTRDGGKGEVPASLAALSPQDWYEEAARARSLPALLRWAAVEPDACLAWVRELPADLASALCGEIAGSLIAGNPEQAVAFIDAMAPGNQTDEMLRQAGMEMATRFPDRALEWAAAQPDEANRDLLLSAVHLVMAATDPRRAVAETQAISSSSIRNKVLVEICQRWAQQDRAKAAEFVRSLPAETALPAAIQIASSWPDSDLGGCVAWIGTLPETGRGEVVLTLVSRPSLRDRAALERLIQSTDRPELAALIRRQADLP